MVCEGLNGSIHNSIESILQFPTTCDYYFYLKMMGAIWVVLTTILWRNDSDRLGEGDFISSMGVSSIAVIFISLIGTLLTIIQRDIFILITVIGLIIIAIWQFKN